MEALDQYRAAHAARDVEQLKKVFPTMPGNQIDALRNTFQTVRAYIVEIRDPRIQFSAKGDEATVDAALVRRMTPDVGNPQSFQSQANFRLRRTGPGWVITQFTAR